MDSVQKMANDFRVLQQNVEGLMKASIRTVHNNADESIYALVECNEKYSKKAEMKTQEFYPAKQNCGNK